MDLHSLPIPEEFASDDAQQYESRSPIGSRRLKKAQQEPSLSEIADQYSERVNLTTEDDSAPTAEVPATTEFRAPQTEEFKL